MFVDTSVVVAILSKEPDARRFSERLEAGDCLTSGLVISEAVMRLSTKLALPPTEVESEVQELIEESRITIVIIDRQTAHLAVEAFSRYGKGRGHPARLNIADCLSYACAKAQGVALLYKGDDFTHTDLGSR